MIPGLTRSYECLADVAGRRIVKFADAAASSKVAVASAATDPLWGVSDSMGGRMGGMVDVVLDGLAEVQLGGTVTAGSPLTADANGKAVALVGAAGAARRTIGFAEQPGVADDIILMTVDRSVLQLPA